MLPLALLERRPATVAFVLLCAGGTSAGLAACGGDSGGADGKAAPPVAAAPAPAAQVGAQGAAVQQPRAGLQQPRVSMRRAVVMDATSAGMRPKTKLRIKVDRVIDPIRATAFQRGALTGTQRFVGVQITLRNVGSTPWAGAPSELSTLLTRSGAQAIGAGLAGSCGGPFSKRSELAPGSTQRGCLTYMLPAGTRPALFQFSPDYPATPAAEWRVPRSHSRR